MFKIITNNHPRPIIDGWELSLDERQEFDYINWDAVERGEESASFVRYRGELIDLGDVMRAEGEIANLGWDGFNSDTFFSGFAFKYVDNCEYVVVARVYAE